MSFQPAACLWRVALAPADLFGFARHLEILNCQLLLERLTGLREERTARDSVRRTMVLPCIDSVDRRPGWGIT